jgi:hypothetical protein
MVSACVNALGWPGQQRRNGPHMSTVVLGRNCLGRAWLAAIVLGLTLIARSSLGFGADPLSISDFVGHFRGAAQVQAGDRFFIHQLRDADVDVRAEPDGFRIRWTTVIHSGERNSPAIRRRSAEMRFVTGPKATQFRSLEPLEPFAEKPTAWAYIKGNTLIVHVLSILSDGNYELQTYERSVNGNVMTLSFFRVFPGRPELVVSGRLMRQPE